MPRRRCGVRALLFAGLCACPVRAARADQVSVQAPPAQQATELNNRGVREAQAGRFDEAVTLLRRALTLNPADSHTRRNLSGILTDWIPQLERQGRIDEAIAALQEAAAADPGNGLAFVRLGDLLYLKRSDLAGAIRAWQQAHGKIPSPAWQAVSDRVTQAQRDQIIERGFVSAQTPHFEVRCQSSQQAELASLGRVLERAYDRLAAELGGAPSRITVLLYSEQDLRRVYHQRDWAIGFYDGRVRLRLDDLAQPFLPDLIAHELAHAFLHQVIGDQVPTWIHEGYAQLQERGVRSTPEAARIEAGVASRASWIPLQWLDRHFEQPTGSEDVSRAYAEAKLAVRQLVARHGVVRFKTFLTQLGKGTAIEEAYRQSFAPSTWDKANMGIFD